MATAKSGVSIKVDEGAYRSLLRNGSLLPIGIKKVKGPFKRGDSVAIQFKNKTFAYGLCDYDSKDVLKIIGKKVLKLRRPWLSYFRCRYPQRQYDFKINRKD